MTPLQSVLRSNLNAKALTKITGTVLLAGSAAFYAMSAAVDGSDDAAGASGRSAIPAALPAFSIIVESHRATRHHASAGARSNSGPRGNAWTSMPATADDWGALPPDPRS